MNWNTVRRTLYPCPIKSIFQYKSSVNPQWWNFNGYGAHGHGETIAGEWDYIFSFAEIDGSEIKDHIRFNGFMMYAGKPINDNRFTCLWDEGYFIYQRILI